MNLENLVLTFINVQQWVLFFRWVLSAEFVFVFLLLGHGFDIRKLVITCTYFLPIYSTFLSWVWGILFGGSLKCNDESILGGNLVKKFIKVQGWVHFVGWLFSIEFVFVFLPLDHGFDIRELFITCMYFFPFRSIFFPWTWEFSLDVHKSTGMGPFFGWVLPIEFCFMFLLLGHGFDVKGLLIIRTYFFSFPLNIFFMSLGNSVWKFIKVQGWVHFLGRVFSIEFVFEFLPLDYGFDIGELFITCTCFFYFPLHIFFMRLENLVLK